MPLHALHAPGSSVPAAAGTRGHGKHDTTANWRSGARAWLGSCARVRRCWRRLFIFTEDASQQRCPCSPPPLPGLSLSLTGSPFSCGSSGRKITTVVRTDNSRGSGPISTATPLPIQGY